MLKTHTPGARKGADFLAHVDPHQLKAQGVELVGVYLKNTTRAHIDAYHKAGVSVFLIHQRGYEGKGPNPAAAGTTAGLEAAQQAKALGYPKGLSIVFASMGDYDNTAATLPGSVSYFRAAAAALKAGGYMAAGAYGDWDLLARIGTESALNCQAAAKAWSWNWLAGKWRGPHPSAHLLQLPSRVVAKPEAGFPGVAVDPLDVLKPVQAWGPGPDVPPTKPVVAAKPVERRRFMLTGTLNVALLQQQLAFLKLYPYKVDGKFGKGTEDAVRRFQAQRKLSITGIYDQRTADALSKFLTDLRALAGGK